MKHEKVFSILQSKCNFSVNQTTHSLLLLNYFGKTIR